MSTVFFLIALLAFLAFPCSIIAIIVYKIKLRNVAKQSGDSSAENDLYASYMWKKKISKIVAAASIPVFFLCVTLGDQYGQEEDFKKNMAKIEKMSEADRSIYEAKYNEIMQEKNGKYTAQKTAIQFVEKNHSNIERVDKMTGAEKAAFNAKFAVYSKKMSEADARDKALSDIDAENKKAAEELQKKYDDQAQYEEWVAYQQKEAEAKAAKEKNEAEERKNQELQKMYDDQAKYEEWIAWKQKEAEEEEAKKLQKMYDDQAKYEEWMAWKQQEAEKAERERPIYTTANEMISLYDGNKDAAISRFQGRKVSISGCVISYAGDGQLICEGNTNNAQHSAILVINAKEKIPNYLNLRAGDVITINGEVTDMRNAIGTTSGLGGTSSLYGYRVKIE